MRRLGVVGRFRNPFLELTLSDYPDLVEELVKSGITSVSVNADAINRTRELVYNIEKKQHGKN